MSSALWRVAQVAVRGRQQPLVRKWMQVRFGGGPDTFNMRPNEWTWRTMLNQTHLWLMIYLTPTMAFIGYQHFKHGEATLHPIPEGYLPKEEEYHANPVTRWTAKHLYRSFQCEYEKTLHKVWQDEKYRKFTLLRKEVYRLQREDGDYKGIYYVPVSARYFRYFREEQKQLSDGLGYNVK